MKTLHLEIYHCNECPYSNYDDYSDEVVYKQSDKVLLRNWDMGSVKSRYIEIPEWCEL